MSTTTDRPDHHDILEAILDNHDYATVAEEFNISPYEVEQIVWQFLR